MRVISMQYRKIQFAAHGESDKKQSWYWNVLVKNMGSWANARKAVVESRKKADLFYQYNLRIKI